MYNPPLSADCLYFIEKTEALSNRNFPSLPLLNLLAYLHLYPSSFMLPKSWYASSHQKLIPSQVHRIPSSTGLSKTFTSLVISSFLSVSILLPSVFSIRTLFLSGQKAFRQEGRESTTCLLRLQVPFQLLSSVSNYLHSQASQKVICTSSVPISFSY